MVVGTHRYMHQTNSSSSQVTATSTTSSQKHLKFLTPAPHHNISLSTIKQLSPHHYILTPSPDPSKQSSRLWFHFQVNCYESGAYCLRIEGITKKRLSWNGCYVRRCGTCGTQEGFQQNKPNGRHEQTSIEDTSQGIGKWKRVPGNGMLSMYGNGSNNRSGGNNNTAGGIILSGATKNPSSGGNKCAIEISLKLKKNTSYEIAYFQPYTVAYMRSRLKRWHQTYPDRCKVEKVTDSFEGRPVNLVTICTNARGSKKTTNLGDTANSTLTENGTPLSPSKPIAFKPTGPKPTICITGRVHSGEVPSSWIVDGLLEFLIESDSEEAQRLRDTCCFRVVPLLNVDGVAHGYYRSNALGEDMNRLWLNPSAELHPEIFNLRKLLLSWKDNDKYSLDFFVDVHAHSNGISSFMYYNFISDMTHRSELMRLPKLLSNRSNGMFSYKMCAVDRSVHKVGCSRRALGELMQLFPFAYTLETSFLGYPPGGNGRAPLVPFHAQQLKLIGVQLAHSLDEFYHTDKSKVLSTVNRRNAHSRGRERKRSNTATNSPVGKDDFLWNEFVLGNNRDLLNASSNLKRASASADDVANLVGIRRQKAMPTISRLARLSSRSTQGAGSGASSSLGKSQLSGSNGGGGVPSRRRTGSSMLNGDYNRIIRL